MPARHKQPDRFAMRGTKGERIRWYNVSDVRAELRCLYYDVRDGKRSPAIGNACKAILELFAKLMIDDENEVRARELEGKINELAELLRVQGKELPEWARDVPEEKERPN